MTMFNACKLNSKTYYTDNLRRRNTSFDIYSRQINSFFRG